MRGEDPPIPAGIGEVAGSPPHARGRLYSVNCPISSTRITPACAGKTCTENACAFFRWDHPRMRGEDGVEGAIAKVQMGSPPHARGRHDQGDAA